MSTSPNSQPSSQKATVFQSAVIPCALIVAHADNLLIGKDNTLPWHLPEDLKHFKKTTLGKPIIMGRKTWQSLGKALPGRTNIVITQQKDFTAKGALVSHSLEDAIALARTHAQQEQQTEIMIIGGAHVYTQALPLCDRLYITQVHLSPEGDAFFPSINVCEWDLISQEKHQTKTGIAYTLKTYQRLSPSSGAS